jgi:hypothetical protein
MSSEHETSESKKVANEPAEQEQESGSGEQEFKVTVRKLEMPVRPRGVLAE